MSNYSEEYVKLEEEVGRVSRKALKTLASYNFQRFATSMVFYFAGYDVGYYLQDRYLPHDEHNVPHLAFMFLTGVFFVLIARLYFTNVKLPKVQEKYENLKEDLKNINFKLKNVKSKLVEEYIGMKLLDSTAFDKSYTIHSDIFKDKNIVFSNSKNEKFLLGEYNYSNIVTMKDEVGHLKKFLVTFDDDGVVYYAPYNSDDGRITVSAS